MKKIEKTPRPRCAVLYCRVSTKEQMEDGNSLVTQEKICREFCKTHEFRIAKVFIEKGETAKTKDRTELKNLLHYCSVKKNEVTHVVIYKVDRMARVLSDYGQIKLFLKKYGVEIVSSTEPFDDTPAGRFVENMIANVAQFDNEVRAERCAGGMLEAAREGRYVWKAPIGYKNVKIGGKATIAPDEKYAPLIKEAFEIIATDVYPIDTVRKIMVKKGLRNRNGTPISRSYFYTLFANVTYKGDIQKFGEVNKGLFEPIVSEELYEIVQNTLNKNGRKKTIYKTDNPDFPLRRFVKNEEGAKVTGAWSRGSNQRYAYYRFKSNGQSIPKEKFEGKFLTFLNNYAIKPKQFELIKNKLQKAVGTLDGTHIQQKKKYQKKIAELKEKQTKLINKNLEGVISDDLLQQHLATIDKELSIVYRQQYKIPDEKFNINDALKFLEQFLTNPCKVWLNADISRKVVLQSFNFPQGVKFENNEFGTNEICNLFKLKDQFLGSKSAKVNLRDEKLNDFSIECKKLKGILTPPLTNNYKYNPTIK